MAVETPLPPPRHVVRGMMFVALLLALSGCNALEDLDSLRPADGDLVCGEEAFAVCDGGGGCYCESVSAGNNSGLVDLNYSVACLEFCDDLADCADPGSYSIAYSACLNQCPELARYARNDFGGSEAEVLEVTCGFVEDSDLACSELACCRDFALDLDASSTGPVCTDP